jgi:hypothetical protein
MNFENNNHLTLSRYMKFVVNKTHMHAQVIYRLK